jgi:hypothetical protein
MRSPLFATKPAPLVLWAGMALTLLGLPAVGWADFIIGNLGAGDSDSVAVNSTALFAGSFTICTLPELEIYATSLTTA